MKTETYPLAVPSDLYGEIRKAAQDTGLSIADAMRQSIRLGLPKLREQLASPKIAPMSKAEAQEAFAPDPEWDAVESAMTKRAFHRLEED